MPCTNTRTNTACLPTLQSPHGTALVCRPSSSICRSILHLSVQSTPLSLRGSPTNRKGCTLSGPAPSSVRSASMICCHLSTWARGLWERSSKSLWSSAFNITPVKPVWHGEIGLKLDGVKLLLMCQMLCLKDCASTGTAT